jgi:endoglucanase
MTGRLAAFLLALVFTACTQVTTPLQNEGDAALSRAPAGSVVATNGMLKVSGNRIKNSSNNTIQLKGMSFFWSQWSGDFWTAATVNNLVDSFGCTIVRAAMGVESGGYLTNPAVEKARVVTVTDAAVAKGVYVIIDWHDHNAQNNQAQAVAFFTEMANKYKNVPNVIFEIYNEPDYESWSQVKAYSIAVIKAIRDTGANNLIIVGTPTWSQDVNLAADDPITGYANIAYTIHFYAATHKQSLRDKCTYAMNKGIALMATEWGTCEASGDGYVDVAETNAWLDFLAQNSISWCNWSLFDKNEAASALKPGASKTGPWPDSQLTTSGALVKSKIGGSVPPPPPPPPPEEQKPYKGTPYNIGSAVTIQAEDYDLGGEGKAFHDTDSANSGGSYRNDGVDIQACGEGGFNVGWTEPGEWLEYGITVPTAGSYKIDLRVASLNTGRRMHVEVDGVNVTGSITVNGLGGWQNWQTVTTPNFNLTSGNKILRVVFDTNGLNLNHMVAKPAGDNPPPPPPPPPPPGGALKIQYKCNDTSASANLIKPEIRLVNTGNSAISLSNVKIRYYYTRERTVGQQVSIWWCSIGSGAVSGAWNNTGYVELSFASSAGTLAPGASVQMSLGINNSDWSNYTQTNDYSFGPAISNLTDYTKITAWQNGSLVWGAAP